MRHKINMKVGPLHCVAIVAVLVLLVGSALAQYPASTPPSEEPAAVQNESASSVETPFVPAGTVITPDSSVARPEDAGQRAHTNVKIFVPAGAGVASVTPSFTFAETPASLGCTYLVGPHYTGCRPSTGGTLHPAGGWGAIALVDAYDNPNAAADLATFSANFGLPAASFTKVCANGNGSCTSCPGNVGWGLEEDLDIQWAHAMAPQAKIYLVEGCSNSYTDLLYAEYVAGGLVNAAGGGDISNSWGSGEFSGETSDDNYFYRYYWKNITYFASAGDSGLGAQYPSSSPWVVSAGGTRVNRAANQNFLSESCWSGSGGGTSTYELWQSPPDILNGMGPWSGYQYELFGGYPYNPGNRATPDFSFDSDPASGVYVYDSYGYGGWVIVGGTSVASPSLAGIVNIANNRLGQAPPGGGKYHTGENNLLYSQLNTKTAYAANFRDVTTGSNGASAGVGWDYCTGLGTPRTKLGK